MKLPQKNQQMVWISGWGIPLEAFQKAVEKAFSEVSHAVFPPTADAVKRAFETSPDWVGTYSLGSLLWFNALADNKQLATIPGLHFAPIFAFPAEADKGGRVKTTQLKYLLRWLRKDPLSALTDFYDKSEIHLPPQERLPYAAADLEWGLQALLAESVEPSTVLSLNNQQFFLGAEDALLEATYYEGLDSSVTVVAGVGHDFAGLLSASARAL